MENRATLRKKLTNFNILRFFYWQAILKGFYLDHEAAEGGGFTASPFEDF